jgi:two-component system chemotaxis response regulator CheB
MIKKRVFIADDSPFIRQALKKMLSKHGIEVLGTAANGEEAVSRVLQLNPDLLLLDLEMPKLDGFSVIRILMKIFPLPIIVFSSKSSAENVFKAMELGAIDFIPKPVEKASHKIFETEEEIIRKIQWASLTDIKKKLMNHTHIDIKAKEGFVLLPKVKRIYPSEEEKAPSRIVMIGASTGGPTEITQLLSQLPYELDIAILIAQHMPYGFTKPFAERLNKYSSLNVKEGESRELVKRGNAYITPGGYHMEVFSVENRYRLRLLRKEPDDKYVPSIDVLFKSGAKVFGERAMGILLTGMGTDGIEGMKFIRDMGGVTIAESEETSILYGMPKSALEKNVAQMALPLYEIPSVIIKWASSGIKKESS